MIRAGESNLTGEQSAEQFEKQIKKRGADRKARSPLVIDTFGFMLLFLYV